MRKLREYVTSWMIVKEMKVKIDHSLQDKFTVGLTALHECPLDAQYYHIVPHGITGVTYKANGNRRAVLAYRLGGWSQFLSICWIAQCHSATKAFANWATPSADGVWPPHMAG